MRETCGARKNLPSRCHGREFAALALLRSSRAKRLRRALTRVWWPEARGGIVNGIPPFAKAAKDGAPGMNLQKLRGVGLSLFEHQ